MGITALDMLCYILKRYEKQDPRGLFVGSHVERRLLYQVLLTVIKRGGKHHLADFYTRRLVRDGLSGLGQSSKAIEQSLTTSWVYILDIRMGFRIGSRLISDFLEKSLS
jgi:hypothetical protein